MIKNFWSLSAAVFHEFLFEFIGFLIVFSNGIANYPYLVGKALVLVSNT
jgi:hypothetical protein